MPAYNLAVSAFSFLGFGLITSQLGQRYQAWNTGSVLYIVWTSVMCLTVATNAIAWNGNVTVETSSVWCDICSRLILGGNVAIPAATLCINRRIHQILTLRYQRHRDVLNVLTDTCIGLGIPGIVIGLYSVVQHYRFFVLEDVGCYPAVGPWKASIPLDSVWPLLVTLISMFYSGFAWRAAFKQRSMLEQNLNVDSHRPTAKRFKNLVILCLIQNIYQLILSLVILISMIPQGTDQTEAFWLGWETVHANISVIIPWFADEPSATDAALFPSARTNWQGNGWAALAIHLFQWTYFIHAVVYFALLGCACEAKTSNCRICRAFKRTQSQSHQSTKQFTTTIVLSDIDMDVQTLGDASQGRPRTRATTRSPSSLASMLFLSFGSVRPAPGVAGDRSANRLERAGDRACDTDDVDAISLDSVGDSKGSGDSYEVESLPAVLSPVERGGKLDRVLGRAPSAAEIVGQR